MSAFEVRIWDVGHGFCAWVQTPAGQSHWIDAGAKSQEFSPSGHAVRRGYIKKGSLDYLVISHSDSDHLTDLPELLENLGYPRVLLRNKNIPYEFKYGTGALTAFQEAYKSPDERYTSSINWSESPQNPSFNGGAVIKTYFLESPKSPNSNNYSVVAIYKYKSVLVVFPGDIEDSGWQQIQGFVSEIWSPLVNESSLRFLVAPHHGRASGFSDAMMKFFSPHVCIICDGYGKGETDNRFRSQPIGVMWKGAETKYLSTKTSGRILVRVDQDGTIALDQIEHQ